MTEMSMPIFSKDIKIDPETNIMTNKLWKCPNCGEEWEKRKVGIFIKRGYCDCENQKMEGYNAKKDN